ncbi:MAG: hypothetical protein AAGC58_06495, partial [Asticcacaulis sp.]
MTNHCSEVKNSSSIMVEEHNKKAEFKNKDRIDYKITRVDDCIITHGLRSDYIVSKIGSCSAIIELKGTDVA